MCLIICLSPDTDGTPKLNGAREERGVLGGEKLITRVVFDLVGSERNDVESVGYIERWGWGALVGIQLGFWENCILFMGMGGKQEHGNGFQIESIIKCELKSKTQSRQLVN